MTGVITIQLLGAPVGKGRPRFLRATGHAYTPPKTRAYEAQLSIAARMVMGAKAPLDGALEVGVVVLMPIPESWSRVKRGDAARGLIRPTCKPDADNFLKVLDALNGIVWRDDSQITDTQIRKRYGHQPALQIFVRQIETAELVREQAAA